MQSRGEALICTSDGTVVAAVEMADAHTANIETGIVRMVKAWEFPRDWSSTLNKGNVAKADGVSKLNGAGDYAISVFPLHSPHNATKTLHESLRIVVAIPLESFADSVLMSMRLWFIATSSAPVIYVLLAALGNIYIRYLRRASKELKHMSIAELQELTRKKKDAFRQAKAKEKELRDKSKGRLQRSSTMGRLTSFMSGGGQGSVLSRLTSRGNLAALEDDDDDDDEDAGGKSSWLSRSMSRIGRKSEAGTASRGSSWFGGSTRMSFFRKSPTGNAALEDVRVDAIEDGDDSPVEGRVSTPDRFAA